MGQNSDLEIMVIEDYTPLRKSLQELISMHYKVVVAQNTKQARELISNHKPNLIVSDVMMPNEDGFQFVKLLKSNPDYALIPVIFLTALNDENNLLTGFESGAVDYMTKPFKNQELLVRIKAILNFNKIITNHLETKHMISSSGNDLPQSEDKKVERKIMEFLGKNYSNPALSLPQIAGHLNMSISSLERWFKRTQGDTVSIYIKKYRLTRAEIMIKQEIGNVFEISTQCGFATQQYFSKCFKEHFGMSPTNYRFEKTMKHQSV